MGDTSCCTKCNTSSHDRDHGRQGTLLLDFALSASKCEQQISFDLLFLCLTHIQIDANTSLRLMEPSASLLDYQLTSDMCALYPDVPTPC